MRSRFYPSLFLTGLILAIAFSAFLRGGYQRILWAPLSVFIVCLFGSFLILVNHRRMDTKLSPLMDLPLLGFFAFACVSYINSVDHEHTLFELMRLACLVMVYFIAAYAVAGEDFKKSLAFALVAIGFLEAVYALSVFTSGSPLVDIEWLKMPTYERYTRGTFGNKNHFAGFMEMTTLLCFGLIAAVPRNPGERSSQQASKRLILLIPAAIMILGLVLSLSRGGWLSFLAGVVVFLVLYWWHRHSRWSRLLVLGILVAAVAGVFMKGLELKYLDKQLESLKVVYKDPKGIPAMSRFSLWKSGAAMVRDHPATGTGWGTFKFVYPLYRDNHILRGPAFVHNDYIQVAAEAGVPALIFFLMFVIMVLRGSLKLMISRENGFTARAMPGVLAALSAMLVHEFFDFNLMVPANATVFFALAGIVSGHGREAPSYGRGKPGGAWIDALIVVLVLAFAARSAQVFAAELHFERGEDRAEKGEFRGALQSYSRAREILPSRSQYHRSVGHACLKLCQAKCDNRTLYKAYHAFQQSLELNSTYPYHWFETGVALQKLVARGEEHMSSPEPYFEKSVSMDPYNPRFMSWLLYWRLLQGDRDRALEMLPRLLQVYPRAVHMFGKILLANERDIDQVSRELKNGRTILEFGRFLYNERRCRLALEQLRRIQPGLGTKAEFAMLMAEVLLDIDKTEDARQTLDKAFKADPGNFLLAKSLVKVLEKQHEQDEAIKVYMRTLEQRPDSRVLRLLLRSSSKWQKKVIYSAVGEIRLKRNDLEDALAAYKAALKYDREDSIINKKIKRIELMIGSRAHKK